MSQQQTQQDTSNTSTSVNFVPNYKENYSEIERKQYDNSLIEICTIQPEKDKYYFFACLGNKKLTENFNTEADLLTHLTTLDFMHLLMVATAEDVYNYQKRREQQQANNSNSL